MMKITIFLILLSLMQSFAGSSYGQNAKLSLKMNAPLEAILEKIEEQTDFHFFYRSEEIDTNQKFDIAVEDGTVFDVLNDILPRANLAYQVFDKYIAISPSGDHFIAVNRQSGVQQQKISGHVTDKSGLPLPGVSVIIKGTSIGTVTNPEGNFMLVNVRPNATLIFSFVGMKNQEIMAGNKTDIHVVMEEDAIGIDEVVVVGYGIQKKVNMTGSVAAIDFEKLAESRPIMNVSSAMAGLSAGVQVLQGSGKPGSDSGTIRVRGTGTLNTNTPLVLIDGIEWDMNNVNPNDIESISVLKDAASAAIYGSRAANGVILVTSKKGKGKPKIIYSVFGSFQIPQNKLSFVSDYAKHMELINEGCENIGNADIFSQTTIDAWKAAKSNPNGLNDYGVPNYIAYPNTDWFDEILSTGFSQEHNLSISGSSDNINYLVSAGYLDNEGIMNRYGLSSGLERYSFRTNVEGKVNDWLMLGSRIYGLKQDLGMTNISRAFEYLSLTTPGIWPGSPNKWGIPASPEESTNANNIFEKMSREGYDKMFRANITLYSKIDILKGLSFEPGFNYAPDWGDYATWGFPIGRWDYTQNIAENQSDLANATIYNQSFKRRRYNAEALLKYNATIDEHHSINVLAGYSSSYYNENYFNVTGKGMSDWSLHQISSTTEIQSAAGSETDWGLRSWFGRVNYGYKERYLAEANLRYDGSSRFSPESRWGLFPSFSAGWRLSEELFMVPFRDVVSNLKLRASWGKMGNNNSGNYAWQSSYSTTEVVLDGTPTTGLYVSKLGNSQLEWETTTTTDIGLDFGLFANRLSGEIDWYNKLTEGILFTPSLYMTMGQVTGSTENIAAVRNRGIELTLNWQDQIGELKYSVGGNIAFNKNLVTKYKGTVEKYWILDDAGNKVSYYNNIGEAGQSGFSGYIAEGHTLGETYMRKLYRGDGSFDGSSTTVDIINAGPKDGMIRTEKDMAWVKAMIAAGYKFSGGTVLSKDQLWYGDLLYADSNEDGNYGDSNDMNFSGHSNLPKYNFGFNVSASYKGFDFYMLWAGSAGFHLYWHHSYYNGTRVDNGYCIMESIANDHYFYDPTDPENSKTNIYASFPRLTYATERTNGNQTSDFWEYKGDFLKLKNLQLGYTLPAKVTQKLLLSKCRLYVSGENLLTITDFPGLDPEMGTSIDYPLVKQFAFGAQITF
jgi:TonB-linked SusC/RagA family outer membrane protein